MEKAITSETMIERHYKIIAPVILLIAIAFRFFNLGGNTLWLDEAIYANNSHTDFAGFLSNTRGMNSSPILLPYLYYVLGDLVRTPLTVRIVPAIFGCLSIACVLLLPRGGVPRTVAALSALWLALSSTQIQYAQEVREYSLSVLVSCALLLTSLVALQNRSKAALAAFAAVIALIPFASYGAVFMILAVLFVYFVQRLWDRNLSVWEAVVLPVALFVPLGLTYVLTARYQMGVGASDYLAEFYPPGGVVGLLKWVAISGAKYLSFAAGGKALGFVAMSLLAASAVGVMMRKVHDKASIRLLAIFVVLVAGSLAAAVLKLYPFGGIRQHLYAAPLVVLCAVTAAVWLGATLRFKPMALVMAAVIIALSLPKIPAAYAENEDIISAVSQGLAGVDDKNVYVYYGAQPALAFHYPDRMFHLGSWKRGEIEVMASEIIAQMPPCEDYLLFSHVVNDEDKDILAALASRGVAVVSQTDFIGASVVKVSRCKN